MKKKIKHMAIEVSFMYVFAVLLRLGIANASNLTTYLSIVIGFLLSAVAILYNSPLRNLLYNKDASRSENKWYQLMDDYLIVIIASLVLIVTVNIDFSHVKISPTIKLLLDIIPASMKHWDSFLLAACATLTIEFVSILFTLFKNFKFPINDK